MEHSHQWFQLTAENGEKIYFCESCDATKDSDGGIIE